MKNDVIKILRSWMQKDGLMNSTENLINWIGAMNQSVIVHVKESVMRPNEYWYFNENKGRIENKRKEFFSIQGIQYQKSGLALYEQPIIVQPEIGFLGIICKEFDGIMYFLMQAKVEPGNVNGVQISPTIQATKSNFQCVHGGKLPEYFSYFENSKKYTIIFDQVQSEQGMRFYKKRNRNIMIKVDEEIEIKPNFQWMTLGQIKELMKIDNLVNMDTRTVLACIPFSTYHYDDIELSAFATNMCNDKLFHSIFTANIQDGIELVYNYLNSKKMFLDVTSKLVKLQDLQAWEVTDKGISCNEKANFDIRFYDIEISGREVRFWKQPLVRAAGKGIFGLMVCLHEGMFEYLVAVRQEIGAFDSVEIGPTIFCESVTWEEPDWIETMFHERLARKEGVLFDSLFSEEGGRFYHEQNRNIIMEIEYIEPQSLPEGYFWMSYSSLNGLIQINNCLNIQLRNLLSIIDIQ